MPQANAAPTKAPPRARHRPRRVSRRRTAERRVGWVVGGVLWLCALGAVAMLFQLLGRAPLPVIEQQLADRRSDGGAVASLPTTPPTATLGAAAPAAGPVASGVWSAMPAAPPVTGPALSAPVTAASASAGATTGNVRTAVSQGNRSANPQAVLPFMPGSQVMESDAEPQANGGGTWAATLSSVEAADKVVDYYRQQLAQKARQGGSTVTEVNPGPGQVLLSVADPADGSHSAVWIGPGDGQVVIRLMRTLPATP